MKHGSVKLSQYITNKQLAQISNEIYQQADWLEHTEEGIEQRLVFLCGPNCWYGQRIANNLVRFFLPQSSESKLTLQGDNLEVRNQTIKNLSQLLFLSSEDFQLGLLAALGKLGQRPSVSNREGDHKVAVESIAVLLSRPGYIDNIDINAPLQGTEGDTPLTWAVREQNVVILQHILARKPEIDQRNQKGFAALALAVAQGKNTISREIICLLRDHGANASTVLNDQERAKLPAQQHLSSRVKKAIVRKDRYAVLNLMNQMIKQVKRSRSSKALHATAFVALYIKYLVNDQSTFGATDQLQTVVLPFGLMSRFLLSVNAISGDWLRITEATVKATVAAAAYGHLGILQALIQAGVTLDATFAYHAKGMILETAIIHGRLGCVDWLLQQGAWADAALHKAASHGRTDILARLLTVRKQGATAFVAGIDCQDAQGQTPLMHAVFAHHRQGADLLLAAGAKLWIISSAGATALSLAALRGNVTILKKLTDDQRCLELIDEKSPSKVSDSEHKATMTRWIDHSIPSGDTALMIAVYQRHIDCVKALLAAEADAYVISPGGDNAMNVAARRGDLNIFTVLLSHCQKTNNIVKRGQLLKLLNRPDKQGRTLLMHAVTGGCVAIVTMLCEELHVCVDWINVNNESALSLAVDNGCSDVIALLAAKVNISALESSRLGAVSLLATANVADMQVLAKQGAQCDFVDANGITPLIAAIGRNDLAAARELLRLNATVDLRDEKAGLTPLMHAVKGNKLAALQLLLEHSANASLTTEDGRTAMSMVREYKASIDMVCALMAAGAGVKYGRGGRSSYLALRHFDKDSSKNAFFSAVKAGQVRVVAEFLQARKSLFNDQLYLQQGCNKKSPFVVALAEEQFKVAATLLNSAIYTVTYDDVVTLCNSKYFKGDFNESFNHYLSVFNAIYELVNNKPMVVKTQFKSGALRLLKYVKHPTAKGPLRIALFMYTLIMMNTKDSLKIQVALFSQLLAKMNVGPIWRSSSNSIQDSPEGIPARYQAALDMKNHSEQEYRLAAQVKFFVKRAASRYIADEQKSEVKELQQ